MYQVILLCLSMVSLQAFAVCEQENLDYLDWDAKCSKITQMAEQEVGFHCYAIAAKDACQRRDKKLSLLMNCKEFYSELEKQPADVAALWLETKKTTDQKIASLAEGYRQKREEVRQNSQSLFEKFMDHWNAQGWDSDSCESQLFLAEIRKGYDQERDQALVQLEDQEDKEIAALK